MIENFNGRPIPQWFHPISDLLQPVTRIEPLTGLTRAARGLPVILRILTLLNGIS